MKTYTKSHRREREDGTTFPWIDENLNPNTGDWIAHTRLKSWKERIWDATKGGIECGKDCNHSTYRDLIHPVGPDPAPVRPLHPLPPEATLPLLFHR